MTIHHFYLVAGCLLWLYLLCCLCIKLMLAIRRQRHHARQMQQIDLFLSAGPTRKHRKQDDALLRSCLSDDILFDYLFTRYTQTGGCHPDHAAFLQQRLQEVLQQKIRQLSGDDDLAARNLVIYHCVCSGLSTPVIRQFLQDDKNQAQAQAFAQANAVRPILWKKSEVIA